MQPLTLRSFARAIVHIDADAFFASCEQAVNPSLKGKPVVTGKERGIASAVSYEAKARGVKRGMTIREIKALCPDVIHLPSDYETYSLFSQRMFAIVRRYTPDVEEYSIDECFCDLTGLRRPLRMSYETMAARIKADLEHDLGLTFAVGLAPTKVVAKLASKWQKPAGLTIISGTDLHLYLDQVPIENVWGIGPQTTAYLTRFGIRHGARFRAAGRALGALEADQAPPRHLARIAGNGRHPAGARRAPRLSVDQQDENLYPAHLRPGYAPGAALEKRRERLHQGQTAQTGSPARELFSAHAGFSAYGV